MSRCVTRVEQVMISTLQVVILNQHHNLIWWPEPSVDDYIYVKDDNLSPSWLPVKVMAKKKHIDIEVIELTVRNKPMNNKRKREHGEPLREGANHVTRSLTFTDIEFNSPSESPSVFAGTKVIGKFHTNQSFDLRERQKCWVGTTKEIPKDFNCNRYLIFFDEGSTQYVPQNGVNMVCQPPDVIRNHALPISQDLMKKYLTACFEWPQMRLKEGNLVGVEDKRGILVTVRVIEVDSMRIKIKYENDEKVDDEWITKTSYRLRPHVCLDILEPYELLEFEGVIKKLELPSNDSQKKVFEQHKCNPQCVIPYIPSSEFNKLSPLAIPLFFGWSRELDASNKKVSYLTPCGVKLATCAGLKKYLRVTESNMPGDMFCFENSVNVLDEFVPARILFQIDDISEGKELRPVQLVNSSDDDPVPNFEYIVDAVISEEVEITAKKINPTGCNCKNGCKGKCSCCKGSIDETGRIKFFDPNVLHECGSSCSCKHTCDHRVVQRGVKWPLQIFKTAKKGWGVRALHDLPTGTFLCTYAGEIITEEMSTERDYTYFGGFTRVQDNDEQESVVESAVSDCLIDANRKGNVSRFFNHSCDPNVAFKKVLINSKEPLFPTMAFFTVCMVRAGSELFFDYQYYDNANWSECHCDMPYCRYKKTIA